MEYNVPTLRMVGRAQTIVLLNDNSNSTDNGQPTPSYTNGCELVGLDD